MIDVWVCKLHILCVQMSVVRFSAASCCKDHPKFGLVESTVLTLFHADAQLSAQDPVKMTVGEAVRSGLINNETLGYFIVKTWQFLVSIGLKKDLCACEVFLGGDASYPIVQESIFDAF